MEKLENLRAADSTLARRAPNSQAAGSGKDFAAFRVVQKHFQPYQSKGYVIAARQHRSLYRSLQRAA
jgi:hypothetical protein